MGFGTARPAGLKPKPPLEYPKAPAYVPSEVDTSRIAFLTQQAAAPGLRGLRRELQGVLSKRYDNPNVQSMVAERALSGYGDGVADVMGSAGRQGLSLYAPEYQSQTQADRYDYTAEVNRLNADYQAALQDYYNEQARKTSGRGLTARPVHRGATTADYAAARARLNDPNYMGGGRYNTSSREDIAGRPLNPSAIPEYPKY